MLSSLKASVLKQYQKNKEKTKTQVNFLQYFVQLVQFYYTIARYLWRVRHNGACSVIQSVNISRLYARKKEIIGFMEIIPEMLG